MADTAVNHFENNSNDSEEEIEDSEASNKDDEGVRKFKDMLRRKEKSTTEVRQDWLAQIRLVEDEKSAFYNEMEMRREEREERLRMLQEFEEQHRQREDEDRLEKEEKERQKRIEFEEKKRKSKLGMTVSVTPAQIIKENVRRAREQMNQAKEDTLKERDEYLSSKFPGIDFQLYTEELLIDTARDLNEKIMKLAAIKHDLHVKSGIQEYDIRELNSRVSEQQRRMKEKIGVNRLRELELTTKYSRNTSDVQGIQSKMANYMQKVDTQRGKSPTIARTGDVWSPVIVNNDRCLACKNLIYHMERLEADGKLWHSKCFRCTSCQKLLNVANYYVQNNEIFCATCNKKKLNGEKEKLTNSSEAIFGKRTSRSIEITKGEDDTVESKPLLNGGVNKDPGVADNTSEEEGDIQQRICSDIEEEVEDDKEGEGIVNEVFEDVEEDEEDEEELESD